MQAAPELMPAYSPRRAHFQPTLPQCVVTSASQIDDANVTSVRVQFRQAYAGCRKGDCVSRVLVGCFLMASILVANDGLAQTNARGSIRGYVKDSQDAVLRGARLTATSPDAPGALAGTSDDS